MKKIQYSVYKRETGSAGGKAKNDVFDILLKSHFEPSYNPSDCRQIRILQQLCSLKKFDSETVLIVQYPAISDKLMTRLEKKLSKVRVAIAIIHDLPSVQGMGGTSKNEFRQLNYFDYLIVHNDKMGKYISENGYKGKLVSLEVFDYLHDFQRPIPESPHDRSICVAGNLDKSRYVCDLGKVDSCRFNLYGINKTLDLNGMGNVKYQGLLPSDEIVYQMEGSYGLVWDGESIDTCSGIHGKYLRLNNPHKLSLYIAAGKPIITWKQAAIADFVIKNNIGIVVESLTELNGIDLMKNFEEKQRNILKLKERVASGYYLSKAINLVLKDAGL